MTTDTTALQERLWEAVAEVRDQHPRVFNDAPTVDVVAAVLPIIAAEVREAQAEAFDAGWIERAGRETHNRLSPVTCPPPPARLNPYRATETGDRA